MRQNYGMMTVREEVTVRLGVREKSVAIIESGLASIQHTVARVQPCKCDCLFNYS